MAKNASSKEVTAPSGNNQLPAFLQGQAKTAKIGNIDRSDIIIPRVKLLQAISPEVEEFDDAKSGMFWHTTASQSLGRELAGIPIILRKTYVLWAPRNDTRGILARASDGVNWDIPDLEFTVKPKGAATEQVWKTGKTVAESGLGDFGSSIAGDPQSNPAASLTYEMLWLFPDYLDLGPAIILNTRSAIKPAKDLLSKIDMKPVDHYYQLYTIVSTSQQGDEGPYNNYKYVSNGYVQDEELATRTKELYDYYKANNNFRASDDTEEGGEAGSSSSTPKSTKTDSDKF